MTIDRTAAPVRPKPSERPTAAERSPAASGFADLLGGVHAASSRPAARAASQRHEQAPQAETPAPFILTIATPPAAAPAAVPVTVAAEPVPAVPAVEPAPTGAVAASARVAAPVAPAAEAQPAAPATAPTLPAAEAQPVVPAVPARPAPGARAASVQPATPAVPADPKTGALAPPAVLAHRAEVPVAAPQPRGPGLGARPGRPGGRVRPPGRRAGRLADRRLGHSDRVAASGDATGARAASAARARRGVARARPGWRRRLLAQGLRGEPHRDVGHGRLQPAAVDLPVRAGGPVHRRPGAALGGAAGVAAGGPAADLPDGRRHDALGGHPPPPGDLDDRRHRGDRRRDLVRLLLLGRHGHRVLPHLPLRVPDLGAAEDLRARHVRGRVPVRGRHA